MSSTSKHTIRKNPVYLDGNRFSPPFIVGRAMDLLEEASDHTPHFIQNFQGGSFHKIPTFGYREYVTHDFYPDSHAWHSAKPKPEVLEVLHERFDHLDGFIDGVTVYFETIERDDGTAVIRAAAGHNPLISQIIAEVVPS